MNKNIIDWVVKNDLCSGCGLCMGLPESSEQFMRYDNKGFLRPSSTRSISSIPFSELCPGYKVILNSNDDCYNPLLGPTRGFLKIYAADSEIRYKGSSGGAISAIAVYLLDKKIIDGVIHVGPNKSDPLRNKVQVSTTKEEIIYNCGSRYSPSSPLETISTILNMPGRFLFVGKPCDVYALRQYSKYDDLVGKKIAYMLSFFCAGVPSINATHDVLRVFEVDMDHVESLRYRGYGWPGSLSIMTKEGELFEMNYEDSWGRILGRQVQWRCKLCVDGTGEFADLSFGDAWFLGDDGYPDFSEREGSSLAVERTEIGSSLLHDCIRSGIVVKDRELEIEEFNSIQPSQSIRRRGLFSRILAAKTVFRAYPQYPMKMLFKLAISQTPVFNIKQFAGALIRMKRK